MPLRARGHETHFIFLALTTTSNDTSPRIDADLALNAKPQKSRRGELKPTLASTAEDGTFRRLAKSLLFLC